MLGQEKQGSTQLPSKSHSLPGAPLSPPVSPPVDLTVLDRTDGDICLPTPKSASKSPKSSRSPKPSPFDSAYASSERDSAVQRRGLLLAGAEQLFTVVPRLLPLFTVVLRSEC